MSQKAKKSKRPLGLVSVNIVAPSIGEALKTLRMSKGVTQKQLAKRIGTTQAAVARLEGPRSNPTLVMLDRVTRAMGYMFRLDMPPK